MDIDWVQTLHNLRRIATAYLLALPVAWDRESRARSAGLRTFPLVAVATCGYMLVGASIFTDDQAQSRVIYGLITGMGFIGGGAILKREDAVIGTATAASLWATGAIGLAVALDRLEIAVTLAIVVFVTLRFTRPLKDFVKERSDAEKEEDRLQDDETSAR